MAERKLVNFHFFCGIHEEKFDSLEEFARHRKEMGVGPKEIKVMWLLWRILPNGGRVVGTS